MARVIRVNTEGEVVMSIPAGEFIYIRRRLSPTIEALAEQEPAEDGSVKLTFAEDSLLYLDELHPNLRTARDLIFARRDRKPEEQIRLNWGTSPMVWARLRAALRHAALPVMRVLHGLEFALAYRDEMIVADYAERGTRGWIIPRASIREYLEALPPPVGYTVTPLPSRAA